MNTREEYAEHVVNGWLRAGWIAPAPAPWHITPLLVAALAAQAEASGEACLAEHVVGQDYPLAALNAAPQIPEEG